MLPLWSSILYFGTSEPEVTTTTKCLTNSTAELPCCYSRTPYYPVRSHTWTTTNARSSFTYCVNIYGDYNLPSYSYQTCHPHHRTTKLSTMNDDCIECTTLSSWTSTRLPPRIMCRCYPLPTPKPSRRKRQFCLQQQFRTQPRYLRWVFHYHSRWEWICM